MAFLLLVLSSLPVAFVVYPILKIAQNYHQARKIGLPILITPCDALNPLWAFGQQHLAPILTFLAVHLPSPACHLFDFIYYSTMDWNFTARYTKQALPFKLYAPAFVIVSPGDTMVVIGDPNAAEDILSRVRKDFLKSKEMYGALEIFGPNVDSVNGEEWARHRRITAPPFNERNSGMVWKESLRQASGMLKSWIDKGAKGVVNTPNETMALALHVITAAGFGRTYEFASGVQEVSPGHTMSYRESLKTVIGNLYGVIITSALCMNVPSSVLPSGLLKLKTAVIEFKKYMVDMIDEERQMLKDRGTEKDNLMSILLRSSQSEGKGRSVLSDEEILGNLFIYNLAGHDTTANNLSYAITMLATDRKYQDWIGEEISAVFGDRDNVQDWEYAEAFPKLRRCLALMFETLRLYGPVIYIPKYTQDSSQSLTIDSKEHIIPPRMYAILNVAAIHTNPAYWGPDSLDFRPDRFIIASSSTGKASVGEEQILQPPAGNFIPWASGPRVCPGKKFAQVEFVAVIARLFARHRVSPKLEAGETLSMAVERVRACVLDSRLNVTLSMMHPERIRLVWEEKGKEKEKV